jgi:hypothetical protein
LSVRVLTACRQVKDYEDRAQTWRRRLSSDLVRFTDKRTHF